MKSIMNFEINNVTCDLKSQFDYHLLPMPDDLVCRHCEIYVNMEKFIVQVIPQNLFNT